jgi:hypothetical protein
MSPTTLLIPLALFMGLILSASLHGLAVSGHFPRRPEGPGSILLFGSTALVIAGVVAGITAALRLVPWYAAIIGGGACILAAPLLLQCLSDRFVDGKGALLVFAGVSAIFAVSLIALVTAA